MTVSTAILWDGNNTITQVVDDIKIK